MIKTAYVKGAEDALAATARIAGLDEVKLAGFYDAAKGKLAGAGQAIAGKIGAGKEAAGKFFAGKGATAGAGPHADAAAEAVALAAAEKKLRLQRILGTAAAGSVVAGGAGAALSD